MIANVTIVGRVDCPEIDEFFLKISRIQYSPVFLFLSQFPNRVSTASVPYFYSYVLEKILLLIDLDLFDLILIPDSWMQMTYSDLSPFHSLQRL